MQDESKRCDDAPKDHSLAVTAALAGLFIAGLAAAGCGALASQTPVADTQIIDRAVHNLTPGECKLAVSILLERSHGDPRVLWVWVEESAPTTAAINTQTQDGTVSLEAPRPYAFRPDQAALPAGLCSFDSNSLHAVSWGGVATPFAGATLEPVQRSQAL